MPDTFMITTALDQPTKLVTKEEVEIFYDRIDEVLQHSFDKGDPEYALSFAQNLLKLDKLAGLGMARLLTGMSRKWDWYELDIAFEDYIHINIGLSKETIVRYVRDYEVIEGLENNKEIPKSVVDAIKQRPIKDINAIATCAASCDITPEQWEELADAPDNTTVLQTIRKIKDVPPRKNSLVIRLSRDGSLYAYPGNRNQIYIGELALDKRDDPDVNRAINRIVTAAGILIE